MLDPLLHETNYVHDSLNRRTVTNDALEGETTILRCRQEPVLADRPRVNPMEWSTGCGLTRTPTLAVGP